jgi:hypothetical protein
MLNPYTTLGLDAAATEDDIRAAYRRRAAQVHPDLQPPEKRAAAEEAMKRLNAARDILLDPRRRAAYDYRFGQRSSAYAEPRPERPPRPTYATYVYARAYARPRRSAGSSVRLMSLLGLIFAFGLALIVAPEMLVVFAQVLWIAAGIVLVIGSWVFLPLMVSIVLALIAMAATSILRGR